MEGRCGRVERRGVAVRASVRRKKKRAGRKVAETVRRNGERTGNGCIAVSRLAGVGGTSKLKREAWCLRWVGGIVTRGCRDGGREREKDHMDWEGSVGRRNEQTRRAGVWFFAVA